MIQTWSEYLCFFLIYAFLGWCVEVTYAAVKTKKFVNRGFLFGPVCPIYGVGVSVVLLVLTPLKKNLLLLYAGSFLLTSAIELVTGFVLEKLFQTKWWDYSMRPFNIGGYICLSFSILWGFACVFVMDVFHPLIASLIRHIPHIIVYILLILLFLLFFTDLYLTIVHILNLKKHIRCMDKIGERLHNLSEEIGMDISGGVLYSMEKNEELHEAVSEKKEQFDAKQKVLREQLTSRQKELFEQIDEVQKELLEIYHSRKFSRSRLLKAFPALDTKKKELKHKYDRFSEIIERIHKKF